MVIKGHYIGLEVSELERIKTQLLGALESVRGGKTFSEVDMGGKMGKKMLLSYPEIVQELKEINYALKNAMPDVYGKSVKRLVPNFNKSLQRFYILIKDGKDRYLPLEEFEDGGAEAYDPKEGQVPVTVETLPIMNQVGMQDVVYSAINSVGRKIQSVRKVEIKPSIFIEGAEVLTGGVVKDGEYSFVKERSAITYQEGYFMHSDTLSQIARNDQSIWGLYGGAGARYDVMDASYVTPITTNIQKWNNIVIIG